MIRYKECMYIVYIYLYIMYVVYCVRACPSDHCADVSVFCFAVSEHERRSLQIQCYLCMCAVYIYFNNTVDLTNHVSSAGSAECVLCSAQQKFVDIAFCYHSSVVAVPEISRFINLADLMKIKYL